MGKMTSNNLQKITQKTIFFLETRSYEHIMMIYLMI